MQQNFLHTTHSLLRSQQRGISEQMIADTLRWGHCIYRQGLRFFAIEDKALCYFPDKQYVDYLKNMVVIVGPENHIISVYKNAKAIKCIKKKKKRLFTQAA